MKESKAIRHHKGDWLGCKNRHHLYRLGRDVSMTEEYACADMFDMHDDRVPKPESQEPIPQFCPYCNERISGAWGDRQSVFFVNLGACK